MPDLQHSLFAGFLNQVKNLAVQLLHFFLCILVSQMRVGVQGNTNIAVSHDIRKGLGVHTGLRHIGAERVSANMGRDLRYLHFVDFVVLLADALEILLPLKCYHWPFIFDVLFNGLQYRQIFAVGNEVCIQILLNLLFLLSQRKIISACLSESYQQASASNCKRISVPPTHPDTCIHTYHLFAGSLQSLTFDLYCLV